MVQTRPSLLPTQEGVLKQTCPREEPCVGWENQALAWPCWVIGWRPPKEDSDIALKLRWTLKEPTAGGVRQTRPPHPPAGRVPPFQRCILVALLHASKLFL